jgi:uncharacterized repeat protein (TIGR01451 family)
MRRRLPVFILIGCVALAFAMRGQAQDTGDLTAALSILKVLHKPNGAEVLEPTDHVKPGDVVEYRAVYHNQGKTPAKHVLATLPIPEGMEYKTSTAHPAAVMASTDGTTFASVPLKRQVQLADGKTAMREVPYAEYRFLRWDLGQLGAGKQQAVSARVQVSPPTTPTPAPPTGQ